MNKASQKQPEQTNGIQRLWAQGIDLPEDVQSWRRQLIRGILIALVVLGGLAVVWAIYNAVAAQVLWRLPVVLGVYLVLLAVTFVRRVPYGLQAGFPLLVIYGLGVFSLFFSWQLGYGFSFLLILPVLSGLFFGRRVGVIALVLAAVTLVAFGWAFASGVLVIPQEQMAAVTDVGSWLSRILIFVLLALLLLLPESFLFQRLVDSLTRSQELTQELDAQRANLEQVVADRTADVARRSAQLETAAQVARDATAITDVQQLLEQTVHLISERFGFYHTGIFLLDETGQYAVLQAASSEGGQRMLARRHQLRVGEVGIVGYVTGRGEPRVALDVGTDAVYFDNPDLTETRSEMALPLRARGEIIGALDVQSTEQAAFRDEDVTVLQALADQVATAISNARLFQQVQDTLDAERRAYGQLTLGAWRDLSRTQPELRQSYDPHGLLPSDGRWREPMRQAMREGRSIANVDGSPGSLTMPVKVHDQVIGVLDARKPEGAGDWSAEEITLLQTLVDQLGGALETARLYQDTQRHAVEDRLVGEITGRMRQTLDIDTVLRTAVREMGIALGLPRIEVRLGKGAAQPDGGRPDKGIGQADGLPKEGEYASPD
jgi:GAF domain-containing protein